jgi:hypothetical protein
MDQLQTGTCGEVDRNYNALGQMMFVVFVAIWATIINSMNYMYRHVAIWLTNLENRESVSQYEVCASTETLIAFKISHPVQSATNSTRKGASHQPLINVSVMTRRRRGWQGGCCFSPR